MFSSVTLRAGLVLTIALWLLGLPMLGEANSQAESQTYESESNLLLALSVNNISGDCWEAWNDSSADASCSNEHITGTSMGGYSSECTVNALCTRNGPGLQNNSIEVNLNQVDDLSNCNGFLTVGSCP